MELHFLEARVPLVKTYRKTNDGLEKDAYPMVKQVTSHSRQIKDIDSLAGFLIYHSRQNHCLLKGKLSHQIDLESRAGLTDPMQPTEWFCLDFDYLESEAKVNQLLNDMGLGDVSYVMQYGAGHGIDKPFSAHLFFMLDHPVLPELLKYWLMKMNLEHNEFERSISLSRSNAALRWPLDISVANNSMLIYIAPPNCVGLDDPIPDLNDRIRTVRKSKERADLRSQLENLDTSVVEEQKSAKLSSLRKKKGLKSRTFSTKLVSGIEVLSKPGAVAVTGHKEARGFMYLNLNGGDSWGYFHPTDNPEILFNFKGEPNYLTKEIVPEYYKSYRKVLASSQEKQDLIYLAFLDRRSDAYYRGTFDPATATTDVYSTSAVKKLEDFLRQHNQWVGEFVEEWDYVFRFDDSRICVPEERMLNRYQETEFLREARLNPAPNFFPPVIKKILKSALGDDMDAVQRFLNWVAFIVQKRRRAETAWVLSGNEGTGKGLLVHKILAPLFGHPHVHTALMSTLNDPFNAYMENCILLMLDETDRKQLDENSRSMAKLKQAITDPVIPIHSKGVNHYEAKNYMSVILASNSRSAVSVSDSNRRFNVAPFQHNRLFMKDHEIDAIQNEIMDFATILYRWNVDMSVMRTPIITEQGKEMAKLSKSSLELVLRAIEQGDLQSVIDVTPSLNSPMSNDVDRIGIDKTHKLLVHAEHLAKRGEEHIIDRDQLHVMLRTLSSETIPGSTPKFIQMLRHNGLFLDRYGGELGVKVKWQVPEYGLKVETKLEAVK